VQVCTEKPPSITTKTSEYCINQGLNEYVAFIDFLKNIKANITWRTIFTIYDYTAQDIKMNRNQ